MAVGFIHDNAEAIMKVSPISYIKDAEPRGSLFDPEDTSGVISSVYTNFAGPLEDGCGLALFIAPFDQLFATAAHRGSVWY